MEDNSVQQFKTANIQHYTTPKLRTLAIMIITNITASLILILAMYLFIIFTCVIIIILIIMMFTCVIINVVADG